MWRVYIVFHIVQISMLELNYKIIYLKQIITTSYLHLPCLHYILLNNVYVNGTSQIKIMFLNIGSHQKKKRNKKVWNFQYFCQLWPSQAPQHAAKDSDFFLLHLRDGNFHTSFLSFLTASGAIWEWPFNLVSPDQRSNKPPKKISGTV